MDIHHIWNVKFVFNNDVEDKTQAGYHYAPWLVRNSPESHIGAASSHGYQGRKIAIMSELRDGV